LSVEILAGGVVGYILGRGTGGQIIQIPVQVQGKRLDAFTVFDDVAASATNTYEKAVLAKGRVTAVWYQFYNTHCLLAVTPQVISSGVTNDIINYVGDSDRSIAFQNTTDTIPANALIKSGDVVKITAVNSDAGHLHRLRIIVMVEYDAA
jgi:hypothetical protein